MTRLLALRLHLVSLLVGLLSSRMNGGSSVGVPYFIRNRTHISWSRLVKRLILDCLWILWSFSIAPFKRWRWRRNPRSKGTRVLNEWIVIYYYRLLDLFGDENNTGFSKMMIFRRRKLFSKHFTESAPGNTGIWYYILKITRARVVCFCFRNRVYVSAVVMDHGRPVGVQSGHRHCRRDRTAVGRHIRT